MKDNTSKIREKLKKYGQEHLLICYDNMNEEGLADCYAVSVKVLEKFDEGAKQ